MIAELAWRFDRTLANPLTWVVAVAVFVGWCASLALAPSDPVVSSVPPAVYVVEDPVAP